MNIEKNILKVALAEFSAGSKKTGTKRILKLTAPFETAVIGGLDEALEEFKKGVFDVFLVNGLSGKRKVAKFLAEVRKSDLHSPVLVIGSEPNGEKAVQTTQESGRGIEFAGLEELEKGNFEGALYRLLAESLRRKFEEHDSKYKTFFESLSLMFYIEQLQPAYRIAYVSPAFESLGYTLEEWYSTKMFPKIMHPDDWIMMREENKKLENREKIESDYEYRVYTKDGEMRWWKDCGRVIFDENGQREKWIGVIFDVTERKKAEQALEESERRYREIFENASDVIYVHDLKGNYLSVNQTAEKIFGYTREEAISLNVRDILTPDSKRLARRKMARLLDGKKTSVYQIECLTKEGKRINLEVNNRIIYRDGEPFAVQGTARDITDRKRLIAERDRFYALSSDVLATIDFAGNIVQISPAWKRILGYETKSSVDRPIIDFVHPSDRATVLRCAGKLRKGESVNFEVQMKCQDKSYRWFEWRSIPVVEDRVSYAIARDITERKQSQSILEHNALHDSLTGLPNREHFMKHLELFIERSALEKEFQFAVLFIDLDRFKIVNDSLGHLIGDKFLISIGKRIKSCVRPSDVLARLGGDEFTILLSIKNGDDAIRVAERIQEQIAAPFRIEGYEVFSSASVGIIISDEKKRKPESYLRDADAAMYRAKGAGKARYEIYDQDLHADNLNLLKVESDLRRAIEKGEFRVFYQPIVDVQNGQISELEALIRWEHPEKGLVFPDKFIPIAEETGLIVPIGGWVIEEACRQILEWEKKFALPLKISVNLSAKQLMHPFLVTKVKEVLEKSGLSPDRLKLEVTESAVMNNTDIALKTIRDLNQIGVHLSTDDFGTGYSSLSYLHLFPFERIKIDRSFIGKMDTDLKNEAIVRSIMMLGQNLEIEVVAEGIENEQQLWQLRSLGCKLGQGYLFSKPMGAAQTERLLADGLPIDFKKMEAPFLHAGFNPTLGIELGAVQ
ncbi:MAG: EAL domain-containing protein [Pyrinomonadaceae bacterium]